MSEKHAREGGDPLTPAGDMIREAALWFRVQMGVKGAVNIITRYFATQEEADARAARWRSSNSTGEYWATVKDVRLEGGVGTEPEDIWPS